MTSLRGIKVLDLSRLLPGPLASLVLADLGAQVDKLEDTGPGDYLRHMPPQIGDTSSIFLALNRNKRSCALDLKKPGARDAVLSMAARYDVVLEQFRPGVLERLGVSHEALLARNPRLVVCALTGYGQTGPLASRAGHDLNYLARAGVLGMMGPADRPPTVPGFQLADVSGGLYAVIGILAALRERDATGKGSVVDVAMIETAMPFAISGFGVSFAGQAHARGAEPLTGGIAPYRTYATKDGRYMALGALEPKFWGAFCAHAGLTMQMSDLMPGPHQAERMAEVEAVFAARTFDEWVGIARDHDFCLEPVLTPEEARRDEHLSARRMFFEVPSPQGELPQLRTPLTATDRAHTAPPRHGEHTEEILREAGLDEAALAALRASGAIR